MESKPIFNPKRDIAEVENFGYVDLPKALITNQIPSDLNTPEESFNEIPLNELIGRPDDVFDGMEYGTALRDYSSAVSSTAEGSKEPKVTPQSEGE